MTIANLALRFVVELVGVGAFGYWGFSASDSTLIHWLAGIGTPLLVIVVWALLIAPKAPGPLTQPQRMISGTGILLVAALALGMAGQTLAGLAFGAIVVVNAILLLALGGDAREAIESFAPGSRD